MGRECTVPAHAPHAVPRRAAAVPREAGLAGGDARQAERPGRRGGVAAAVRRRTARLRRALAGGGAVPTKLTKHSGSCEEDSRRFAEVCGS